MAKPITIPIVSDSKDVAKDLKRGVEEPLDRIQEKYSDVARAGEESGDSIVSVYRDAERQTEAVAKKAQTLEEKLDEARKAAQKVGDADKDVRGLGNEMDKAARDAEKLGKAGKNIGDDVKRGTDRAEEGLGEFRDEADSVAREAATSFDGSAESISDVFRDLAANAFVGFGPLAAGAGIAISAGIGIGVAKLEEAAEKSNEAKEAALELSSELVDVQGDISQIDIEGKMREWAFSIADTKEWFELFQESAVSNFEQVQDEADRTGIALDDMLGAMSGLDGDAALRVLENLEKQTAELQAQYDEGSKSADAFYDPDLTNLYNQIEANEKSANQIRTANGLTEEAIQAAKDYEESMRGRIDAAEQAAAAEEAAAEAAAKAAEDKNALLAELDTSLDNLVGSWTDYQDAETGALDPAAYLENVAARSKALTSYSDNIALIADQVSPEALNAIMAQGIDFAPMLQSIIDNGLVDQMNTTFSEGAASAQTAIDTIDGNVKVDADTSALDEKLSKRMGGPASKVPDVTVKVDADTSAADERTQTLVTGLEGKSVSVNVAAVTAGAAAQLDELTKDRSATLNISADPYSANADWAELVKDRQATLRIGADPRAAYRVASDLQKPIESTVRFRPDPSAAYRVKGELARETSSTHRIQADPSHPYRVLNDLNGTITKSLHIVEVEQRVTRRVSP